MSNVTKRTIVAYSLDHKALNRVPEISLVKIIGEQKRAVSIGFGADILLMTLEEFQNDLNRYTVEEAKANRLYTQDQHSMKFITYDVQETITYSMKIV